MDQQQVAQQVSQVDDFLLVCEKIIEEYFLETDSVTTSYRLYKRKAAEKKVIDDCFECYSKHFSSLKSRQECEKKLINNLVLVGNIKFSTMFWTISSSPDQNIKAEFLTSYFQVVWQHTLDDPTKEHLATLCPLKGMVDDFSAAKGIVAKVVHVLPNIKNDLLGIVRGEEARELPPWIKHSDKYLSSSEEFKKKIDSFEEDLKGISAAKPH